MKTFLAILIFLVGIDQWSKWWAMHQGLVAWNSGLSFGLGATTSQGLMVLTVILVLVPVGWLLWQWGQLQSPAGVMILAGSLSNLIDRLIYGAVRDWLPLPIIGGFNNVADWLIVGGMVYLVIWVIGFSRSQPV